MTVADGVETLPAWAVSLWPSPPSTETERRAFVRQCQAIRCGRIVIDQLLEPWRMSPSHDDVAADLLALHLYARVLDDALDEGEGVHRLMALRAQPLLWRATTGLALCRPDRVAEMDTQICRVVAAAEPGADPWARNAHLLLGPIALHVGSELLDLAAVEQALALLQATEDLSDGTSPEGPIEALVRDLSAVLRRLRCAGWRTLADRVHLGAIELHARLRESA